MKTSTLLRPGTARRIGYGRSVVVCAARPGALVRDGHLEGGANMFGGQWPRVHIGAEPAAVRHDP